MFLRSIMVDQPLDLSCPPRFWANSVNKNLSSSPTNLSVSIPRRFSHCSDNVSFSSDRSPSVSPASDRSGRPSGHQDMSDLSTSDSDREILSPGPHSAQPTQNGPATKRFLSKYIKEQVGKNLISFSEIMHPSPTLILFRFFTQRTCSKGASLLKWFYLVKYRK